MTLVAKLRDGYQQRSQVMWRKMMGKRSSFAGREESKSVAADGARVAVLSSSCSRGLPRCNLPRHFEVCGESRVLG